MQMRNLYANDMQSFWCPRWVELTSQKKNKKETNYKNLDLSKVLLLTLTTLGTSCTLYSQFFMYSKFSTLSKLPS